jgi:hypothetical protein
MDNEPQPQSYTNPPRRAAAPNEGKSPNRQFGLKHTFYAIAVFASSLAMSRAAGIFSAVAIVMAWGYVFAQTNRRLAMLQVAFPLMCYCCLCLPGSFVFEGIPREFSRRYSCSNHLKEITLALHNYHDQYGSFPPAYVVDKYGNPMHSWRVLILPFLDQGRAFSSMYNFDEPWNSRNNSQLAGNIPSVYRCPSHTTNPVWTPFSTNYVAVVDSRTAWPGKNTTKRHEFPDGTFRSILVFESDIPLANWMEPRDLSLDEALKMLEHDKTVHPPHIQDVTETFESRNIALADGTVSWFPSNLPHSVATGLFRIDDGLPTESIDSIIGGLPRRNYYGNLFRFILFLLVVLFPLPWAWRKQKPTGLQNSLR